MVTEDEVKVVFVSAYNRLVTDKREIIANAEIIRKPLCRTDVLEEEKRALEDEMSIAAESAQGVIAENARIAQNQEEYQKHYYNALVESYDTAKAQYDEVVDAVAAKAAQSERLLEFIRTMQAQDDILAEFEAVLKQHGGLCYSWQEKGDNCYLPGWNGDKGIKSIFLWPKTRKHKAWVLKEIQALYSSLFGIRVLQKHPVNRLYLCPTFRQHPPGKARPLLLS